MSDAAAERFVLDSLPPAPARVLEVGAGDGSLAGALRTAGYDVIAIDPAADGGGVIPVALLDLDEPADSFDAAAAVFSMHHVEPLHDSCRRLGEVVRPGGALVLDELDVTRFDEPAIRWWLDQRGDDSTQPGEVIEHLRHHCHELADVLGALEEWFSFGQLVRGPYLYRWELSPSLRVTEEELIAADRMPATGARVVGARR